MNKYDLLKRVFPNLYFSKIVKVVENRYKSIKDPIAYTKDIYYKNFGCELNLDDPRTFYEKICFLKLFYHEEQPQNFVDKILVKEELKKQGYEKLVAKTICSFASFNDFKNNLDSIKKANKQFVIKLNHTSGDVFFYLNNHWADKYGDKVSKRYVFAAIKNKLKMNYYHVNLERVYERVVPKVFIEEYLESANNAGLDEYKFFMNNGEIKMLNVVYGRQKGEQVKEAFTDANLKVLPVHQHQEMLSQEEIYKPECFDEMVKFCKKTVSDKLLIRVDLMTNGKDFKFCEFTYYDCAGFNIFEPLEYNAEIGSMFNIEKAIKLKTHQN